MAELVKDVPRRALAVYAHPDDADVAIGGTLALWAARGCDVRLVVCTDGARGTLDPSRDPSELARMRAAELEAAAGLLGLTSWEVLGWRDGELEDNGELREGLVRVIREHRPDVVCGHDPTAIFFGQDYFNHRDHRKAGWALLDAIAPASMLPLYFPEAGPSHHVPVAYLSGTLEPDVWVDITETVGTKAVAVECHRSQLVGAESWAGGAVKRRAEEEGRRAGVRFAEGFRRLRIGG